jgi:hypothetical protein
MSNNPSPADPALQISIAERQVATVRLQGSLAMWRSRRVFGITQKGRMGIFPEGAAKGDVVCVIMGARTPFEIRPEAGGTFRFVGEAYVHGLMHGEVFDLPNFEELRREISLR